MPDIHSVLETVLYVDDLETASRFYEEVVCLQVLYADSRMRALDVGGRNVLLLFVRGGTLEPVNTPGGTIPPHDGSGPLHIAFAVEKEMFPPWRTHLREYDVTIESEVEWPRGGRSLYFRDPDGHLVEFATPGLWRGH